MNSKVITVTESLTKLMWEKIKEFNFGVDFAVLQNRINITADAYRRLATDKS